MSNRFWQPLLTSAQQFVITWFVIRSCTIVHYSCEFLWISLTLVVLFSCSSLLCCACLCLHFLHVAFYLLCSLFMVPCFSTMLPIVCVFTMYYFHIAVSFFHVAVFMSHFFHFFIFLSSLISFHVALFLYSTFLCCTFFMLHF